MLFIPEEMVMLGVIGRQDRITVRDELLARCILEEMTMLGVLGRHDCNTEGDDLVISHSTTA